jgi:hypothetical protein
MLTAALRDAVLRGAILKTKASVTDCSETLASMIWLARNDHPQDTTQ